MTGLPRLQVWRPESDLVAGASSALVIRDGSVLLLQIGPFVGLRLLGLFGEPGFVDLHSQARARRQILRATFIIILFCVSIAVATVLEIRRRLRELDRSSRANFAAREFNRNILDSMVEALFTLNSEGQIISANSAVRRIVGRPRAQLLGAHYRDLFELWARGRYFTLAYSKKAVDSVKESVTQLEPARTSTQQR